MKYIITLISYITIGFSDESKIGGATYLDFVSKDDPIAFM